jgi:acetone carboxylase gamma subunit
MIILDKPYVSDFLKTTIRKNKFPVLHTEQARPFVDGEIILWEEERAIQQFKENPFLALYTTSENSIQWITERLPFTKLPEMINVFKDKGRFRQLLSNMQPDFFFREVPFSELEKINIQNTPKPFIIKPCVGFFSMGVYRVNKNEEWHDTIRLIKEEKTSIQNLYPKSVLDAGPLYGLLYYKRTKICS